MNVTAMLRSCAAQTTRRGRESGSHTGCMSSAGSRTQCVRERPCHDHRRAWRSPRSGECDSGPGVNVATWLCAIQPEELAARDAGPIASRAASRSRNTDIAPNAIHAPVMCRRLVPGIARVYGRGSRLELSASRASADPSGSRATPEPRRISARTWALSQPRASRRTRGRGRRARARLANTRTRGTGPVGVCARA